MAMSQFMLFSNCAGSFVFNNNYKLRDKILYKSNKEIIECCRMIENNKETPIEKHLLKKYHAVKAEMDKFSNISKEMEEFIPLMHKNSIIATKNKVKESVKEDLMIVQAICNVDEIDKTSNIMAKRLREWYSYYLPEFSDSMPDNEKFVEITIKKGKNDLLREMHLDSENSMGADLPKEDVDEMIELAKTIQEMYRLREKHTKYLERIMDRLCPNLTAIAGVFIGAKLFSIAGSLEKLSKMPGSTIQVLGAEKAFFRHLKTGAKPPKYGFLINHPAVTNADRKDKGKAARMVADKLAIAAKVDFFRGDFIGDKLRKMIEKRFGWKSP